jgi:hypothetical protein
LATSRFGFAEHSGDLAVSMTKNVVQQKSYSFVRAEAFKQQQERDRKIGVEVEPTIRQRRFIYKKRFREPVAVRLTGTQKGPWTWQVDPEAFAIIAALLRLHPGAGAAIPTAS